MFLLHGTLEKNVVPILKKGKLLARGDSHDRTIVNDKPTNQLFTQLIYKGIPYESDQVPHWFYACFVLDITLLKDHPFYAIDIGGFGPTFKEGFDGENYITRGRGHYKRMPNLKLLREHINSSAKRKPWLSNAIFMHSHELLFGNNISLKKYCIALVVNPSFPHMKQVNDIAKEMNIKVVTNTLDGHGFGLTRYIEMIKRG
jgi:hypothetical protein